MMMQSLDSYLAIRRAAGFQLNKVEKYLRQFVRFSSNEGKTHIGAQTAIEWARRLHKDTDIQFEVADLFEPFRGWVEAFEFVLEIYTIQPLPMEMRSRVIDAVSSFVAPAGRLVVVTRGRADDETPEQLPWPLSRRELARFAENGLIEIDFREIWDDEDEQIRFVVEYVREDSK